MLSVTAAEFPPRTLLGSTLTERTIGRTVTVVVLVVKFVRATLMSTVCTELTMLVLKVKVLEV